MKILNLILIMWAVLFAEAFGEELPPMPDLEYTSTNSLVAGVAPLPPGDPAPPPRCPRRVIRQDRHVYVVGPDEINWYFAQPLYRVEHCTNLVSNDWHTVAVVDGTNYIHRHAEGFYRVRQIKRPTPPPTLPPVDLPSTNAPAIPADATTNTNRIVGRFR